MAARHPAASALFLATGAVMVSAMATRTAGCAPRIAVAGPLSGAEMELAAAGRIAAPVPGTAIRVRHRPTRGRRAALSVATTAASPPPAPPGMTVSGRPSDCNPCCKSQPPPDPGPSCGARGGDYCSQSAFCPPGYDSLGPTYDCNPCCVSQPPPPPPSEAGGACRAAGYSTASDENSYQGHYILIEQVAEDYRYWGAVEGHDGMANLLQYWNGDAPSVCNLSPGICSGSDQGCPGPDIGYCSGRKGAPTCGPTEYCDGRWSAVGYPVNLPPYSFNPFKPMNQRASAWASSFSPVDCDCVSFTSGHPGSYVAVSLGGQFVSGESTFRSISQSVSDAGRLEARAAPMIRNVIYTAWVCVSGTGGDLGAVAISSTVVTP